MKRIINSQTEEELDQENFERKQTLNYVIWYNDVIKTLHVK